MSFLRVLLRQGRERERERRDRGCRPNSHKFDIARRVARMLLKQPIKRRKLPSRSVTTLLSITALSYIGATAEESSDSALAAVEMAKREIHYRAISPSRGHFLHSRIIGTFQPLKRASMCRHFYLFLITSLVAQRSVMLFRAIMKGT